MRLPVSRVVTFCDEPQFSEIVMFIKGRDCLDDKSRLAMLAPEHMPETHIVKGGLSGWDAADSQPSGDDAGPWFVKETNKNGGRAIKMCASASECISLADDPQETYVVQRHVPNPDLTKDGRKWHYKMYSLLVCEPSEPAADGAGEVQFTWTLRCHEEAYLCLASEEWSADNLTAAAQLTIKRTKRFKSEEGMEELGADANACRKMFERASKMVASIVGRAIESKGLEGRPGKTQFELFSTDFMFEMSLGKARVIEVSLQHESSAQRYNTSRRSIPHRR